MFLTSNGSHFLHFAANLPFSFLIKHYSSVSFSKSWNKRMALGSRKGMVVRESSSPDSTEPIAPIAPLQMESPIGQFLSQIFISHPHLVLVAVEQQLQQLQTDRDAEQKNKEPCASGTDSVLYRSFRSSKLTAKPRRQARAASLT